LLKPIEESMDEEDDNYRSYESLPDELQDDSEIKDIITKYISTIQPPKFIKVKEIIEKEIIPNNQKVIIWTIFIQNAKELQIYLQKN
jgi:ERCC4-related helicase